MLDLFCGIWKKVLFKVSIALTGVFLGATQLALIKLFSIGILFSIEINPFSDVK